jgi:hypothetical protein
LESSFAVLAEMAPLQFIFKLGEQLKSKESPLTTHYVRGVGIKSSLFEITLGSMRR